MLREPQRPHSVLESRRRSQTVGTVGATVCPVCAVGDSHGFETTRAVPVGMGECRSGTRDLDPARDESWRRAIRAVE